MQIFAKLPVLLRPAASISALVVRRASFSSITCGFGCHQPDIAEQLLVKSNPCFSFYLLNARRLASLQHSKPAKMASLTYLDQDTAQKIDRELFDDYKFSVDQLMELAGLSVATAVAHAYPLESSQSKNLLVVVGPGNNGGDGLVAARHLKLFGYTPSVYYPKRTDKELYANLVTQCTKVGVKFLDTLPSKTDDFGVVIDALFGFSFKPPVRGELQPAMKFLLETKSPICSVDVPSGWPVNGFSDEITEHSSAAGDFIRPDCLVSLMAPKLCSKQFKGTHHYVGGRFVPDTVKQKYKLSLVNFPGTDVIVNLNEKTTNSVASDK